jgi:hypothetical protein
LLSLLISKTFVSLLSAFDFCVLLTDTINSHLIIEHVVDNIDQSFNFSHKNTD